MSDLRKELVKLAHDVPSMRKHLVPLLALQGTHAAAAGPKIDAQGSGDWMVYFETDSPDTIHRWSRKTRQQAEKDAEAAQKKHGGFVTVQKGGIEVTEFGPKGKTASSVQVTYSTSANDVMFPFLEELAFSLALKKGMLGAKPSKTSLPEGPMVTLNVTDFALSLVWSYTNKVLEVRFIDFSVDTNGSVGTAGKEFVKKFPLATVCKLPMQTLASALALKLPR